MNSQIKEGLKLILSWKPADRMTLEHVVENFYSLLQKQRDADVKDRYNPIFPHLLDFTPGTENAKLIDVIVAAIGKHEYINLLIFLLQNDHRFTSDDTIKNYKKFEYPSYLIQIAYSLIFFLPKGFRNRELFDVFWDHQAQVAPGIDEQCAKQYMEPFIEEGITTKDEIKELLIKDWWRAQEAPEGSLYYGPSWGLTYAFFGPKWEQIRKTLEVGYKTKTGRDPKKIW